jgi:hypothetical protein
MIGQKKQPVGFGPKEKANNPLLLLPVVAWEAQEARLWAGGV